MTDRSCPYRIVTAVALADGHDAAIVAVNRALRQRGFEVIYVGFNKGVESIVRAAIEEDADVIGLSSYNGGHLEFAEAIVARLAASGSRIPLVLGGGGTITADDTVALREMGVAEVFPPGMAMPDIAARIEQIAADHHLGPRLLGEELHGLRAADPVAVARALTAIDQPDADDDLGLAAALDSIAPHDPPPFVLGVAGVGGAGKSTMIDELLLRHLRAGGGRVAVLCCDPSASTHHGGDSLGGALLGDRIRMLAADDPRVYIRSLATRRHPGGVSGAVGRALRVLRATPFEMVLVESAGIGQADAPFLGLVDLNLYVMTSEFGSALQLEKTVMLDEADVVVLNKCDNPVAVSALKTVAARLRSHASPRRAAPELFGVSAVVHRDPGMDRLYDAIVARRGASRGASPAGRS